MLSIWGCSYLQAQAVLLKLRSGDQQPRHGNGKRPTILPPPCTRPGFTEPAPLDAAGALLPHLCTLTGNETSSCWRYFSVALSSRSLALGVTQQVWSLGCPDFPQRYRLSPYSATASPTLPVIRVVYFLNSSSGSKANRLSSPAD
jgi:hypothetical protein